MLKNNVWRRVIVRILHVYCGYGEKCTILMAFSCFHLMISVRGRQSSPEFRFLFTESKLWVPLMKKFKDLGHRVIGTFKFVRYIEVSMEIRHFKVRLHCVYVLIVCYDPAKRRLLWIFLLVCLVIQTANILFLVYHHQLSVSTLEEFSIFKVSWWNQNCFPLLVLTAIN